MQARGVMWIGALCGLLASAAAHAIDITGYQAARGSVTVTTVTDLEQYLKELPPKVGQVIEIDGVVNGVIANSSGSSFMLRTTGGQTLLFSAKTEDPDIDVAIAVRVLACVPRGNTVLECLAATPIGPELAVSPIAVSPGNPSPVTIDSLRVDTGASLADLDPDTTPVIAGRADAVGRADGLINPTGGMPVDSRPPDVYYKAPERFNDRDPRPRYDFSVSAEYIQAYADRIQACNARIGADTAAQIAGSLLNKCRLYGVDPRLMFALVAQESRFNPKAVSRAGAQGLGQLMPGTAAGLGVRDSFDIDENLDGATRYLAEQLNTFGKLSFALAAYNAGPGAVKRYGGVPPYRETRNYVRVIWNHYCELVGLDPQTGEPIASR